MSTFQQLSDKTVDKMTDDELITAIKSTVLQEPTLTDLQTLGKFTVIMYRDNNTST